MKLEQTEVKGRVCVVIPHDHWHCPNCGVGYLDGAGLQPKNGALRIVREFPAEAEVVCKNCNWECTAFDVYYAALKREKSSAKKSVTMKAIPVNVNFTGNEVRLLKEVLQRAKLDCQCNIVAQEEGEGGTMAMADRYREYLADVNKMLEKLS